MHEAGLMRGLIRQLETLARQNHSERIVGVKLRVRDSGAYAATHFEEHFVAASLGTVAEGASVDVQLVADERHLGDPQITIVSIEVPA